MTDTSRSPILVLGTLDPSIREQLDALAAQHGVTIVTELAAPASDPLAEAIEQLRIEMPQMPQMARPHPTDSLPYYRRFERRRHSR